MSSNQNILVKLNKVGFSLNNKWLVKDVSLQVEKGKIVTLIGPNGSGKSTTAKIALGIYKKIDGSVEKYTNKVGYVPQKISIDWTLPLRVNDLMGVCKMTLVTELGMAISRCSHRSPARLFILIALNYQTRISFILNEAASV